MTTLNGFPFGDFHAGVVKRRVYRPDWTTDARAAYTLDLVRILASLVPAKGRGSISTLPLGWRHWITEEDRRRAAAHLRTVAAACARVEADTGITIHVDIEPEPGCALERSEQVISFFESQLFAGDDEDAVRHHVRVCHDVCHAAVMFEDQQDVLDAYARAGIGVGKIQLSSAVEADFEAHDPTELVTTLRQFAEPRYLHQTTVAVNDQLIFYDDLGVALACAPRHGRWRVHFHVPVFLDRFGVLGTTQADLGRALDSPCDGENRPVCEVETYAWNVLPEQPESLAHGIARELAWVVDRTSGGAGS